MNKSIVLFILTAFQGFSSFAQHREGDYVVGLPVSLYNSILDGWSACEKISELQRIALSTKDSIELHRVYLDSTKNVSISYFIKKDSLSTVEINKVRSSLDECLSVLKSQSSAKNKPSFFYDPKTYIMFFAGIATGVYIRTR